MDFRRLDSSPKKMRMCWVQMQLICSNSVYHFLAERRVVRLVQNQKYLKLLVKSRSELNWKRSRRMHVRVDFLGLMQNSLHKRLHLWYRGLPRPLYYLMHKSLRVISKTLVSILQRILLSRYSDLLMRTIRTRGIMMLSELSKKLLSRSELWLFQGRR